MFAILWPILTSVVGWALPRLLAVMGVVGVTETVVKPALDWAQQQLVLQLNGMGEMAVTFLNFMGVFDAIGIIFTAYATALGIKAGKAAFSKNAAKG